MMNLRQECSKLKSQVVESPEKLIKVRTLSCGYDSFFFFHKKMIEDLKVNSVTEREAIQNIEAKTIELQGRLHSLHKIEKEMQKGIKTLQEAETQLTKNKQTRKKWKQGQQKLQETEKVLQEVNVNIQVNFGDFDSNGKC
jgi:hypothetical protein